LKVVVSARTKTGGVGGIRVNPNGLATNLSERSIDGVGSGTPTSSATTQGYSFSASASTDTANTFSNCEAYFPNYTSSNYKSWGTESVTENNATTAYSSLSANLWSSTAAITSLTITMTNPFAQYSSASLYGLAAVGTTPTKAPKASGGSIIQTDGTYWYHAFLASGTFTPAVGLSCDVLVVAGGGGGYFTGGGAGGFRTATSQSISTATTVTVGAGGAIGSQGVNSTFSTITSSGGGRATGLTEGVAQNGIAGGSGAGGGSVSDDPARTGGAGNTGSYSPVEGYAGGNAVATTVLSTQNGGGGGGAGGVGGNGVTSTGGVGGVGSFTAISGGATTAVGVLSGGNYYFAGGGGGGGTTPGAGGLGGGGTGSSNTASNGTPNTGGGGSGAKWIVTTFAKGGSGIVIVRYLVV
jgi:hypothetical protein